MKKTIVFLSLLICGKLGLSQSGWTVNPSAFTYSMNVTTAASIQCVELDDPQDEVGAFVGGTCRGFAKTSNVVNGRYLAFVTVYSNAVSGENVNFKIYDASAGTITDAATSVIFQDGAAFGFPTTPFQVKSNNEPTNITLSNASFVENTFPQFIGKLTTADLDVQAHTYSLVSGTGADDNAKFMISNDSLYVNSLVNFEAKSSFTVRIETNDGGCTYQKAFALTARDTNDNPTAIHLTNDLVEENSPMNTVVGTFSTSDQDVSDQFAYQLVAGAGDQDNGLFSISNQGDLRVVGAINFEVTDSLFIRIRSTDLGGLFVDSAIVITVLDVNETPFSIDLDTLQFNENIPVGTTIITLTTQDQDSLDTHTYTFDNTQTSDNSSFIIVGDEIQNAVAIDYETKSTYVVYIKSDDGNGGVYTQQVILTVNDLNDEPTDIALSGLQVTENNTVGTYIGKFSTTDQDALDAHVYSLVTGLGSDDNADFSIQNDSLFISVATDYETKDSYTIRVRTTDTSSTFFEEVFVISVIDQNDPPTGIVLADTTVDENVSNGSVVTTLTTIDADLNGTYVYSLVAGTGDADNGSFAISGNQLVTATPIDFETRASYSIRLNTFDGTSNFEAAFTITVNDLNEAPELNDYAFDVSEMAPMWDSIGLLTAFDEDAGTVFSYRVLGNVPFEADATGKFYVSGSLDYETTAFYDVWVEVADQGGLKDTALVVITVLDEIETDAALPVNKIVSPNNDGVNDFFQIENVEIYSDYKLTIFNDAGLVVYSKNMDYDNTWDGTYNGTPLNAGVYFYLFQSNSDSNLMFKGQISILK